GLGPGFAIRGAQAAFVEQSTERRVVREVPRSRGGGEPVPPVARPERREPVVADRRGQVQLAPELLLALREEGLATDQHRRVVRGARRGVDQRERLRRDEVLAEREILAVAPGVEIAA